ncbi:autotransporter assembly complex protein TamA [Chthonobacter albigriseus]|uniref:autotransporter assembly complex protein TamA n=1 Tax=Chthonobacter albigriseus TaxID=1683161 RepID=UPI0015EE4912|nr:autotransporter assembly complex family protein [Chthonobacter albigriseus]
MRMGRDFGVARPPRRAARGGGRPVLAVSLVALIAATTFGAGLTPAAAFELFGYTFFEDEKEPLPPDSQPYAVEVEVATPDEDVEERIRASSLLWAEREEDPPPSTASFLSRTRAEYGRIVAGLYADGFYGGTVRITVDGKDPETIDPDAALPKPVPVRIDVDPGPRFAFGEVAISGRAPATSDPDDQVEETPESFGLVPGAIAKSGIVLNSEQALIEEWRQQGYPKADIESRDAVADHPSSTLDVTIAARSGQRAAYGPVSVTGTEYMDPAFVAYMTGLEPGVEYDPDDIEKAEKQLQRLGVFASSRVVEADTVNPDGTLPLTVNVAERPRRVIGGGASYSTVDGAGLEAYWEHRNLFGQAEKLRLEGRVGGVASTDPADFTYHLGATFLKPGVLTPLTDLTAEISARREPLDTYTETAVRARVGLAHEFFEGLSGTVALNLEASEIEDPFGTNQFLLLSLPSTLTYDARDDELNPTSGYRTTLGLEPFFDFKGGNGALVADLEGSTYLSLSGDDSFVLAARAAVGTIVGASRDEIPASRLFFVGGGGSVRGYGFRNVGPRIGDEVVGGRSYVEASLEVRAKVTDSIGIVPFVDVGQSFLSSVPDFSEDLKIGAGIGLRYDTGIGPIRVDAAVPLNPGDDDPAFALYIGLGQAF